MDKYDNKIKIAKAEAIILAEVQHVIEHSSTIDRCGRQGESPPTNSISNRVV